MASTDENIMKGLQLLDTAACQSRRWNVCPIVTVCVFMSCSLFLMTLLIKGLMACFSFCPEKTRAQCLVRDWAEYWCFLTIRLCSAGNLCLRWMGLVRFLHKWSTRHARHSLFLMILSAKNQKEIFLGLRTMTELFEQNRTWRSLCWFERLVSWGVAPPTFDHWHRFLSEDLASSRRGWTRYNAGTDAQPKEDQAAYFRG